MMDLKRKMSDVHYSMEGDEKWWSALISSDLKAWQEWFDKHEKELATHSFTDAQGATPLHWACLLKKQDIVLSLLKAGANVWALDNDGSFPLKIAMAHELSSDWNWSEWATLYPQSFQWKGSLHPARESIGRQMFRFAQLEKWTEIEMFMKLVPISACPHLYWKAPKESGFDKMFKSLGPMPWCYAAVFLQSEKFLRLLIQWGASLTENWHHLSLDKMSDYLNNGDFTSILFKVTQEQYWPIWREK